MKKALSSLMAVLIIISTTSIALAADAPSFSDVPASHWAFDEIEKAVDEGITTGYSDGTFKPAGSVTYAHFAAFLARAFYSENTRGATQYDYWYAPYFEILSGYGITDGTLLDTGFWNSYANTSINRYDMAQMMYNVIAPSVNDVVENAANRIGDWNEIPAKYQNAVSVCYSLGLLNGQSDGNFGGTNYMNRAQACVVIERMKQYIDNAESATGQETVISHGTLANGKEPTEENVLEILAELESEFPAGTPWGSANSWSSPVMGNGIECAGYAFMISDKIFGDLPKRLIPVGEYYRIRPGDVVHMRQADGTNVHWYVVSTIPDEEGYFQATDGNVGGKVAWGGWGTIADIPDYYEIYTRYPTEGPKRDFASKEELRPEVRCAICGYLMRTAGSNSFDTNGPYNVFDSCDKCNNFYACEQCMNSAAFKNHVATCQG